MSWWRHLRAEPGRGRRVLNRLRKLSVSFLVEMVSNAARPTVRGGRPGRIGRAAEPDCLMFFVDATAENGGAGLPAFVQTTGIGRAVPSEGAGQHSGWNFV